AAAGHADAVLPAAVHLAAGYHRVAAVGDQQAGQGVVKQEAFPQLALAGCGDHNPVQPAVVDPAAAQHRIAALLDADASAAVLENFAAVQRGPRIVVDQDAVPFGPVERTLAQHRVDPGPMNRHGIERPRCDVALFHENLTLGNVQGRCRFAVARQADQRQAAEPGGHGLHAHARFAFAADDDVLDRAIAPDLHLLVKDDTLGIHARPHHDLDAVNRILEGLADARVIRVAPLGN